MGGLAWRLQRAACLCLLSAQSKGACHHTWHIFKLFTRNQKLIQELPNVADWTSHPSPNPTSSTPINRPVLSISSSSA